MTEKEQNPKHEQINKSKARKSYTPEQRVKEAPIKKIDEKKKEEEKISETEEKKEPTASAESAKENKSAKKADGKKKEERKVVLEREYIVPLRKEWSKVPEWKRANKAVKALGQFIARHMKVYDRDLRKIKIDIFLNNEIRFRGMRKPPAKIKVKAIKYSDGIVEVKLVNLPKHIEFELARKARKEAEKVKKEITKKEEKPAETKEEAKETVEKKNEKEKEISSRDAEIKIEKQQAKKMKHTTGGKREPKINRMTLQK